jgi:hypothetical protein
LRGARGLDYVADVLARSARDVLALRLVGAARLAARERSSEEKSIRPFDKEKAKALAAFASISSKNSRVN